MHTCSLLDGAPSTPVEILQIFTGFSLRRYKDTVKELVKTAGDA